MSTIWILTEIYFPEQTSTGYLLTKTAEGLSQDYMVKVITGPATNFLKSVDCSSHETRNNVEIFRCGGTSFNKDFLLRRLVNSVTRSLAIFLQALKLCKKEDVLLVVTNPPLLPFVGVLLKWLKGCRFVLLVHDIYPEVLVAAGVISTSSSFFKSAQVANSFLYRQADRIISLGRDMTKLVHAKLPNDQFKKVYFIPNWAENEIIHPTPKHTNQLIQDLRLNDHFVCLYAGNMGKTHGIEYLAETAKRLKGDKQLVHFVFLGFGSKKYWLEEYIDSHQLDNVTILPPRPRAEQIVFLNACDVAIIAFMPGMAGVSVPSRTYNQMASDYTFSTPKSGEAMILATLISYLLLILPSIPYFIGLFLVLLCVFVSTVRKPEIGLIVVTFLSSSYMLIRWKSMDSPILAGFRTEIFFLFIIAYVINSFLSRKDKKNINILDPILSQPLLSFFILWSLTAFLVHSHENPSLFLLAIRENLESWLLFPFIVKILEKNINLTKYLYLYFIFGVAFVALANILNYYGMIDINFASYSMRGETFIHERELFGMNISRMNSFFGMGPSGAGQYYSTAVIQSFIIIGFLLKKNSSDIKAYLTLFLFFSILLLLIYCTLLAVSITSFISLTVAFLGVSLKRKKSKLLFLINFSIAFPLFFTTLFLFDLSYLGISSFSNPISYFYDGFLTRGFNITSNLEDVFFGQGLFLRTATSAVSSPNANLAIDVSWFVIALRMGFVSMLSALIFSGFKLYTFLITSVSNEYEEIFLLSGVTLLSILAYSHSSPMITRPFDYLFVISTASIHVICKRKNLKTQNFSSRNNIVLM